MKQLSLTKKLLFSLVCATITYVAIECVYSTLCWQGICGRMSSFWVYEESGKTIHFDPIRGYRLTSAPSRFARITYGDVEYVGVVVGNNQGFADRDDFSFQRSDQRRLRIAVFGDSMTTAWELNRNWPDCVEDIAREQQAPLELLNFAVDGGGLPNWWSVLVRHIQPQEYQLDGLVFAVGGGGTDVDTLDLNRGFAISEHRGFRKHMWGVLPFDATTWPQTEQEALFCIGPIRDALIVSSECYEAALRGDWRPFEQKPWRPFITLKGWSLFTSANEAIEDRFEGPQELVYHHHSKSPGWKRRMVDDIGKFAEARSLPVLVARVPSRYGLIHGLEMRDELLQFSAALDAKLVDGAEAFSGFTEKQVRDDWHPYDGHWGQTGSDRFAALMFEAIKEWTGTSRGHSSSATDSDNDSAAP